MYHSVSLYYVCLLFIVIFISSHYADILQALFTLAQTRQDGRLMDNICAAVSRMITAQCDKVPLEQVCSFNDYFGYPQSSF